MSASSNREALRRLSRKFPAPPEVEKILEDIRSASDLHAAIVSVALVEAALEELIKSRFLSHDRGLDGQIFLNRGPLTDFHSKILIAQAFGIITDPQASELHSLKVIRNTFAHSKVQITFDHELIDRETKSLRMVSAIVKASSSVESALGHKYELSNKNWFLLVVKILIILIESIQKHGGTADEAIAAALGEKPKPSKDKSGKQSRARSSNFGRVPDN